MLERLAQLSEVFALDLCAYAIMSDHYHLVLHVDRTSAKGWTQQEVIERWTRLFGLPVLVKRWQSQRVSDAERHAVEQLIDTWRERLYDISWFMRCLDAIPAHLLTNEAVALYFEHLKPNGVLAVHISNRYLDFAPVCFRAAEHVERSAMVLRSSSDGMSDASVWVLITSHEDLLHQPQFHGADMRPAAADATFRAGRMSTAVCGLS